MLAEIVGVPAPALPPLLVDLVPAEDRMCEPGHRDELDADDREYALSRNCPLSVVTA